MRTTPRGKSMRLQPPGKTLRVIRDDVNEA